MCWRLQKTKTGLFVFIFCGILAALVAICIWVFSQAPNGTIGTSPGLSFMPRPKNSESTLIQMQSFNVTNYQSWVDNMSQFLEKYYTLGKITGNERITRCSYDNYPRAEEFCDVDIRNWEKCNREFLFGYDRGSPCIFLEFNKINGWTPEYYDNPDDLPAEMPEKLKEHIRSIKQSAMRKNVWVSCEGENAADIELLGPVTYYPGHIQGFPGYYFPFLNQEGYLSPLVAVKFERPANSIVLNVECKAWAKNIPFNRAELKGSVHFELLIN